MSPQNLAAKFLFFGFIRNLFLVCQFEKTPFSLSSGRGLFLHCQYYFRTGMYVLMHPIGLMMRVCLYTALSRDVLGCKLPLASRIPSPHKMLHRIRPLVISQTSGYLGDVQFDMDQPSLSSVQTYSKSIISPQFDHRQPRSIWNFRLSNRIEGCICLQR